MPDSNFIIDGPVDFIPGQDLVTLIERSNPQILATDDGGYILVWQQQEGNGVFDANIMAQRMNADGTANGAAFQVNTVTTDSQVAPEVLQLQDGSFVVSWYTRSDDGNAGFHYQRLDSSGNLAGAETLVSDVDLGGSNNQFNTVLINTRDGFGVIWAENSQANGEDTSVIYMQKYNADGTLGGSQLTLHTETVPSTGTFILGVQLQNIDATILGNGDIALSWFRSGTTVVDDALTFPRDSFFQIFDDDGDAVSLITALNTKFVDVSFAGGANVVALGNGNLLVAYGYSFDFQGLNSEGESDIYVRIFDPLGNALTEEIQISAEDESVKLHIFAESDGNGGAVVGWTDFGDDGETRDVVMQQVAEDGTLLGDPHWVTYNESPIGFFQGADVTTLSDGTLVSVFERGGTRSFLETSRFSFVDSTGYTEGVDITTLDVAGESILALGGDDVITGQEGNDVISGGEGIDTIDGGTGDDVVDGGAGDDIIQGWTGDDVLHGGEGIDTIDGYTGSDYIDGGLGNDILDGGGNPDIIFGGQGADTINGGAGDDEIFGFRDRFTYGAPTELTYDEDFTNILNGGDGNDTIHGGDGADIINGGDGNDTLVGSNNFQRTIGGIPNQVIGIGDDGDTFIASAGRDNIIGGNGLRAIGMNGGVRQAIDVVDYSTFTAGLEFSLRVDAFDGGETFRVVVSVGNTQNLNEIEMIIGTPFGDIFEGSSSDDFFQGGAGDDEIEGNDGGDIAVYMFDRSNYQIEQISGDAWRVDGGQAEGVDELGEIEFLQFADQRVDLRGLNTAGDDTASGVEFDETINFMAGDDSFDALGGNDIVYGGVGDDDLNGGAGDDRLEGGTQNDILFGGTGNDTLVGGSGNDALDGFTGVDTALYTGLSLGVTIDLNITTQQDTGGGGLDSLIRVENLIGSGHDDTLTGTSGRNRFEGGNGADTLDGMGGNDTLIGGNGDDTLNGGDGADTLVGGNNDDDLFGGSNRDRLEGGSGVDELFGGSDVDRLLAGSGDDFLTGGTGTDFLFGGAGNDTFIFNSTADSGVGPFQRDEIRDFNDGDLIDVSGIDANDMLAGDQAFTLVSGGFTGAGGEIWIQSLTRSGVDVRLVHFDVDGDSQDDMQIWIISNDIDAGDFIL